MPIDLYHVPASGPCRTVRLVAAAIGVDLNLKMTNLQAGEHLKPEFLKMNPQHAVPTIDDNGFYLSESRAISTYLIEKYAKNDSLYPKDPKQRALVNQRLFFDAGSLYQPFVDYYSLPVFYGTPQNPKDLEKAKTGFGFLDKFLEGQKYVAGKNLTVADIVLCSTVSNYTIVDFNLDKYPNVVRWFSKVKTELPKYEEINGEGLKIYKTLLNSMKK